MQVYFKDREQDGQTRCFNMKSFVIHPVIRSVFFPPYGYTYIEYILLSFSTLLFKLIFETFLWAIEGFKIYTVTCKLIAVANEQSPQLLSQCLGIGIEVAVICFSLFLCFPGFFLFCFFCER